MNVFIERTGEHRTCHAKNVKELLQQLQLIPEEVLVLRNNTLLTEDVPLDEKDHLTILSVVSGG